jgi:hypothetical protein
MWYRHVVPHPKLLHYFNVFEQGHLPPDLPRCKISGTPSYANAGNRCNFLAELPVGRAEVPPINGAFVPSAGEHSELNLILGRRARRRLQPL